MKRYDTFTNTTQAYRGYLIKSYLTGGYYIECDGKAILRSVESVEAAKKVIYELVD